MIKVKNYITITIVIIVLFFLFISQSILKTRYSDKGTNHYGLTTAQGGAMANQSSSTDGKNLLIYAGKQNAMEKKAREYAAYRHYTFDRTDSLSDAGKKAAAGGIILVDGDVFSDSDVLVLSDILDKDVTVVFESLPDSAIIEKSRELMELLGIQRIRGVVKPLGYHLFSGFLLGGEGYYVEEEVPEYGEKSRQDLPEQITYYEAAESCRLYMIGQLSDEQLREYRDLDTDNTNALGEVDGEDFPAVIWQHSLHSGRVFCINAPFMENDMALGILSAIGYETSEVFVSAFTGARSIVSEYFPVFSNENSAELTSLYGQDSYNFQNNVLWPFLVSAASMNDDRLTLMAADHIKTGAGDYSHTDTYLTMFENEMAELGAVGGDSALVSAGIHKDFKNYRLHCFYGSGTEGLVVTDDSDAPVFQNGTALRVKRTEDLDEMSFSDDLRLRSVVTATGFYLGSLDLSKVFYPENEADRYENMTKRTTGNLNTFYRKFSYLSACTLSEAGSRISGFLSTVFTTVSDGDRITIKLASDKGGGRKLLLRTHGQDIVSISGAEYEKAEKDVYVLTAEDGEITVSLKDRVVEKGVE